MTSHKKTNAMRILDSAGISYEIQTYEYREDQLDAMTAAEAMGVECGKVFKTIVMRTDANMLCVFCVPSCVEVNLKKARLVCGAKTVQPVRPQELMPLTGYLRGGCSPIGMKHQFPTYIDESAILYPSIHVSAGVRGVQLVIAWEDLIRITGARLCDLSL